MEGGGLLELEQQPISPLYLPYISPISPRHLELEQQLPCARLRRIRLLRVRTRLLARLPPRRLEVATQAAYEQLLPRHGLARGAPVL